VELQEIADRVEIVELLAQAELHHQHRTLLLYLLLKR
jgi:hypothetical protein